MGQDLRYVYNQKLWYADIPDGLVVRIRRSHRRGRGSIPRLGVNFCNSPNIETSCNAGMFCNIVCHNHNNNDHNTYFDQWITVMKCNYNTNSHIPLPISYDQRPINVEE